MKNIVQIENNFKINFFIHSIQLKSINLNVVCVMLTARVTWPIK